MVKKINSVLGEVLKSIEPSAEEIRKIKQILGEIEKGINRILRSKKITADLFVGGSFAKNTLIKKKEYDIDLFLRFDKKHKSKNISDITESVLKIKNKKGFKLSRIHGSRDYFKLQIDKSLFFEIIPVLKVKNPRDAENITDLSYSHVRYINKNVKSQKILNDIKIAKAFCHANNCYGAESYVNGFSGYALELLVYKYKSFLGFIKAMSKIKGKEIIDLEKHYKNKSQIMIDLNASKLNSPIILIDPTFKQRNALAALSEETFRKFQKACKAFLKDPSIKKFDEKTLDMEKIEKYAKRKKYEFILLTAKTSKQEGDVAGSKLLKFYNHLSYEVEKFFDMKNKGFSYNNKKSARYFFVVKRKNEILIKGPLLKQGKHVKKFKGKHKRTTVKGGRLYAKVKITYNLKKFFEGWKTKNKNKMKDMSILKLQEIHLS